MMLSKQVIFAVEAFCALAFVCAPSKAEVLKRDLDDFAAYIYSYAERPAADSVTRVVLAAKSKDANVEVLIAAVVALRDKLTIERLEMSDLLLRAAKTGDRRAYAMWGAQLFAGTHIKADPAQGIELLKQAAGKGEPLAEYHLGVAFLVGFNGVAERDVVQAKLHLRSAVRLGMPRALGLLAKIAREEGDKENLIAVTTEAATAGDSDSMFVLYKYFTFDRSARDPVEATRWASRGAFCNHPHLLTAYALALDEGIGTPKDKSLAFRLLQRASRIGNNDADVFLAFGKVVGRFGVLKDPPGGVRDLESLAAKGVNEAQFMLGRMLIHGEGVPRDEKRGRELVEQAAVAGNSSAKLYLESNR